MWRPRGLYQASNPSKIAADSFFRLAHDVGRSSSSRRIVPKNDSIIRGRAPSTERLGDLAHRRAAAGSDEAGHCAVRPRVGTAVGASMRRLARTRLGRTTDHHGCDGLEFSRAGGLLELHP